MYINNGVYNIRAHFEWRDKWLRSSEELPERERKPRTVNPLTLTAKRRISDTLISMLKALPQKTAKVFEGSVHSMRSNFGNQRKRTANKLKNPRLKNQLSHLQTLESHDHVP